MNHTPTQTLKDKFEEIVKTAMQETHNDAWVIDKMLDAVEVYNAQCVGEKKKKNVYGRDDFHADEEIEKNGYNLAKDEIAEKQSSLLGKGGK